MTDDRVPVLINRRFARLWVGQAISLVGDYVFETTVVLWIAVVIAKGEAWAPAAAGAAFVVAIVPIVLIGPIAGVFVDRWDFKRTMLVNDLVRAAVAGALVAVPLLPDGALPVAAQLTIVYAAVFLVSASSQFFTPARFAILGDVMDPADRARASSIGQGTGAIASIIGPPLAAPLLFTAGVEWALAINAVSFLLSFVAIRSVQVPEGLTRPAPAGRSNAWREFVGGLQFFGRSRVLVTVAIAAMITLFGAGSINALDVFFVTTNLGVDPKLYGLFGTGFGVGSIVGAIVAGLIANRLGLTRTYWVTMLVAGVLTVGYARATNFGGGLLLLTLAAVPIAALNSVVGPIILRVTPREYLGRVISAFQTAVKLCTMLSIGIAGWLASSVLRGLDTTVGGVHLRTYDTIFAVAGLLTVGGAIFAMVMLRGADAPEPAAPSTVDDVSPAPLQPDAV